MRKVYLVLMVGMVMGWVCGVTGMVWAGESGGQAPALQDSRIGSKMEVVVKEGKVSVELVGAELGEVLHRLSQAAGIEITVGEGVSGKITMKFTDLPLREGLEKIVGAGQSDYALAVTYNSDLTVTVRNNNLPVTQSLANQEEDIGEGEDIEEDINEPELIKAVKAGNIEKILDLLKYGADINEKDDYGYTALMNAIKFDCTNISQSPLVTKTLLENGADVGTRDANRETALILAVRQGQCAQHIHEIMQLLLNCGADVNAKDRQGYTALMRAMQFDCADITRTSLIAQTLLENGADISTRNNEGKTALFVIIEQGGRYVGRISEIVQLLLNYGADINEKDKYGYTPLMWAIKIDCTNITQSQLIIQTLLEKGADVNVRNNEGQTALFAILGRGRLEQECVYHLPEIVKLLLNYGANINEKDKWGYTALIRAMQSPKNINLPVVKSLLENGADANARNEDGKTALMVVSRKRVPQTIDTIQMLLNHGADTKAVAGCSSVISMAAMSNNKDAIKILVDNGAEVNIRNNGAYANIRCGSDLVPLIDAIMWGALDAAEELIKRGADVNAKDWQDRAPLMWMVIITAEYPKPPGLNEGGLCGNITEPDMVRILLDNGANANAKNKNGDTALKLAEDAYHKLDPKRDKGEIDKSKLSQIIKLLYDAGAR